MSELDQLPLTRRRRASSLYATRPVGPADQPDFINAVAQLETRLSPLALLDQLQALEQRHGRVRERRWGPRTLDLDLLLFDDRRLVTPRLTLPHPEMVKRAFVLVPLAEIAPAWCCRTVVMSLPCSRPTRRDTTDKSVAVNVTPISITPDPCYLSTPLTDSGNNHGLHMAPAFAGWPTTQREHAMKTVTLSTLQAQKRAGETFSCLTAYDTTFAHAASDAGIEVLLVGDSLGMVLQGHASTLPVTLDDIRYHTQCVARGKGNSLLMVDLPS